MTKKLLAAAALAALVFGSGVAAPAQARMADPALSEAGSMVQTIQYRYHRRHHWRGWRHRRNWHCWRGWHGRRHCGWR